jgi:hypothetical protein
LLAANLAFTARTYVSASWGGSGAPTAGGAIPAGARQSLFFLLLTGAVTAMDEKVAGEKLPGVRVSRR